MADTPTDGQADERADGGSEEPRAKQGPLRGRGAGFGSSGEPGGFGAELMRRAREAAEAARKAAEEHRPAAERAARDAAERARQLAEAARPEVERRARQAKVAGEAALPHAQRAAREAAEYAREHEAEIKAAASRGAEVAARIVVPRPLRPAVDAMGEELRRKPPEPPREPRPDEDSTT
jgi:hypothetical protein